MTAWDQFCQANQVPPALAKASLEANDMMPTDRAALGEKWIQTPKRSLILAGDYGRGKTYFMFALLKGVIEKFGIGVARFFRSKNIDDRIMEETRQYGAANYFLTTLKEIPLLFIDDFGVERSTERAERDYFELIDERVAWNRPTVVSTNLEDIEIKNYFGGRIHSRLKQSLRIDFEGKDLRGEL